MTLIDTSVWVDYFRRGDTLVSALMSDRNAGMHPFVVGEIAVGNVKNRARTLADFAFLAHLEVADDAEVHRILESQQLWGKGLGWIDLHILAATKLAGWSLYTADAAMAAAARQIGVDCLRSRA